MSDTSPLYVRLPRAEAEKLDRAAFELKAHKRDLVAGLVARYVDPNTRAGLEALRTLSTAEIPPPAPERRRTPRRPTLAISEASNWVAGMQAEIREFAKNTGAATPLVRITLDDGEQLFLQALTPGPGDDYVNLAVYPLKHGQPRRMITRLDAVKKVELLETAPGKGTRGYVFKPRGVGVGFSRD